MKAYKYLVSVRLMTYNHEPYIKDAIDGILNQKTNFLVEVVIGDDFSTDNTLAIINKYTKDSENIKFNILRREKGDAYWKKRNEKGRLYNFLNILDNCQGKYIALLDGDDYWTDPLKLQKQVDFMEANSDCSMCYHSYRSVFITENKIDGIAVIKSAVDLKFTSDEFIKSKYARTVTILFRSTVIQNYPEWTFQSPIGDYPLQMICALRGNIGYIAGDPMGVYRVGVPGSTNDGRFGTKEEQKKWIRRRLYNYKKSRDLFNKHSDYKYDLIIQKEKQNFSYKMLNQDLDIFSRLEILKLFKEYMPSPLKMDRRTFRFSLRFILGSKLVDKLRKNKII